MCDFCMKDMGILDIKLTDNRLREHGTTLTVCPNHMAVALFQSMLDFEPDTDLVCEITGEPGAVKFESVDETYILKPSIMLKLINLSLTKTEYRKLIANRNGKVPYMLHEDFYGPDGTAYQPRISNKTLKLRYPNVM